MKVIGNGSSLESIERRRFLKEKSYTANPKSVKGKKNRRTA